MEENRLEQIESQLAFQEDAIETLNQVIVKQQSQIDKFNRVIDFLSQKVKEIDQQSDDNKNSDQSLHQEKPPHY